MPLAILAVANAAFSAIKEGCELYKEYKGTLIQVKETFDEVNEIREEVVGFWELLWKRLFPPPAKAVLPEVKPDTKAKPKTKQKAQWQDFDETAVMVNLVANLSTFFECLEKLHAKIREDEERSRTVYDPNQSQLTTALNRVVALSELKKLQEKIRHMMCWEAPAELEDLYKRVIDMVKVVGEEQEIARLSEIKKNRDEVWLQLAKADRRFAKTQYAVVTILAMVYVAWFLWSLQQDNMTRRAIWRGAYSWPQLPPSQGLRCCPTSTRWP